MATMLGEKFTPAELRAIELHKYYLSERSGFDIGLEAAASDWLEHYALQFRQERQARMLEMQRQEIARHTWIESEKAGCDLGRSAALDWVLKYAASWRDWYNRSHESFS
jgi:hypothetical protein